MNRYQLTITVGAHTSTVWVQAKSKEEAQAQVHIGAERDSIHRRMSTEYNPRLRPTKKPVTA